jgi:hypothetical protein
MEDHVQNLVTQNLRRFHDLRAKREAGQISQYHFLAEIQKLRWQDGHGVWYTIDPTGTLLRYDGRRWIAAQPVAGAPSTPVSVPVDAAVLPAVPTEAPASVPTPMKAPGPSTMPPASQNTTDGRSLLKRAAPLLAIVPSLACGSLWFLYTFIGVFKYEGLKGIDFITPMIVSGLPVLF